MYKVTKTTKHNVTDPNVLYKFLKKKYPEIEDWGLSGQIRDTDHNTRVWEHQFNSFAEAFDYISGYLYPPYKVNIEVVTYDDGRPPSGLIEPYNKLSIEHEIYNLIQREVSREQILDIAEHHPKIFKNQKVKNLLIKYDPDMIFFMPQDAVTKQDILYGFSLGGYSSQGIDLIDSMAQDDQPITKEDLMAELTMYNPIHKFVQRGDNDVINAVLRYIHAQREHRINDQARSFIKNIKKNAGIGT